MLNIVFFASVKERLGCAALELEWGDATSSLERLVELLCQRDNGLWRDVLRQENIIRAVNQSVVAEDIELHDYDEVAFFPPVTGG